METTLAQETRNSQWTQHTQTHSVAVESQVAAQQWFRTGPNGQFVLDLQITAASSHLITRSCSRIIILTTIEHQQIVGRCVQCVGVNRQEVIHIIRVGFLCDGAQVAVITIAKLCLLCFGSAWIVIQVADTRVIRAARHDHGSTGFLEHLF